MRKISLFDIKLGGKCKKLSQKVGKRQRIVYLCSHVKNFTLKLRKRNILVRCSISIPICS